MEEKMKAATQLKKVGNPIVLSFLIVSLMTIMACDQRSTTYVTTEDNTPPPVPVGVTTITGDGVIWVEWEPIIGVPDLDGFKIWRSDDNYEFFLIATVGPYTTQYSDYDVNNGWTYYYGVSSFDENGNESQESFDYDFAFDTPRPEGFDEVIFDLHEPGYAHISGFDFSMEDRLYYDSQRCDIFLEFDDSLPIPTFFIWLGYNGRYIQDMGYTDSFDDITYAPDDGWSAYDYVEAIIGHTYVIQTWDGNFAKIRVTDFYGSPGYHMVFDWGYQIDPGNRELKIDPRSIERESSE
jgi:hypothetical protein